MGSLTEKRAHLPQQVPIEAYGNGGFRFGGMSHQGSMLALPTGMWAWDVASLDMLDAGALADAFRLGADVTHLLLGTGRQMVRPPKDVRDAASAAGIWLEPMDTGAAARTYNIMLAEGRPIAAALIAVS